MATDQFGSGGGFSSMFDAFDDQKAAISHFFNVPTTLPPNGSFPRGGRGTPDVAGLGEGYQVVIDGETESIGGTSASTPMFAGLVSLLNEARLAKKMPAMGYINPWLYKHAMLPTGGAHETPSRGAAHQKGYRAPSLRACARFWGRWCSALPQRACIIARSRRRMAQET